MQDKAVGVGMNVHMEVTLTRLLKEGDRVVGAFGYYRETGRFVVFKAKAVVLATGGWGRMYKFTSNSWEGTGDGLMMAYEAGAELMDMEMVQFHPTGMVWPPGMRGMLVTEGVRGEGGVLKNNKGERFMFNPEYMPDALQGPVRRDAEEEGARWLDDKKNNRRPPELLPRDVVARAIYKEVEAGRGSEHGGVYLDVTHRGADYIKRKLPSHVRAVPCAGRRRHHQAADGGLPDHPLHDGRHPGRPGDRRDHRPRPLRGGRSGGGPARREPPRRQLALRHPRLRQAGRRGRRGLQQDRHARARSTTAQIEEEAETPAVPASRASGGENPYTITPGTAGGDAEGRDDRPHRRGPDASAWRRSCSCSSAPRTSACQAIADVQSRLARRPRHPLHAARPPRSSSAAPWSARRAGARSGGWTTRTRTRDWGKQEPDRHQERRPGRHHHAPAAADAAGTGRALFDDRSRSK